MRKTHCRQGRPGKDGERAMMKSASVLIADRDVRRTAGLRKQLESLSCGPIRSVGTPGAILGEADRMKPDLLILRDDWAAAVEPCGGNGMAGFAILLLRSRHGDRGKDSSSPCRDPFRILLYPSSGAEVRLRVAGALQAFRQQRKSKEQERHFAALASIVSDYAYSVCVRQNGQTFREWSTGNPEKFTGYTEEEFERRGGWRALIHPDDLSQAEAQQRILLGGQEDARTRESLLRSPTSPPSTIMPAHFRRASKGGSSPLKRAGMPYGIGTSKPERCTTRTGGAGSPGARKRPRRMPSRNGRSEFIRKTESVSPRTFAGTFTALRRNTRPSTGCGGPRERTAGYSTARGSLPGLRMENRNV